MSSLVFHPLLTEAADSLFMGSGSLRLGCFCHQNYPCPALIGSAFYVKDI
jgi:hypothetical protein